MKYTKASYFFLMVIGLLWSNVVFSQQAAFIVYEDANACLRYIADEKNNYLPDFSHAGYKNGEQALPDVAVKKTIGPVAGDNTAHIQAALDEVGALPLDANGFRGALLLEPGRYEINGVIVIRESGVVLRGSGQSEDPLLGTILVAIGNTPNERDLIQVGNASGVDWTGAVSGTRSSITNSFVPAGSRSLEVAAPELFSEGDQVIVYHPSTQEWLASIDFGATDVDAPWRPGDIDIYYNRYVTNVNIPEGKITLDVPIFDHIERSLAQAEVYVLNEPDIRQHNGIENLRIFIETNGEKTEDHARNAIRLIGVEDAWVKDVTALHFIYAGIDMTIANRVTVANCTAIEPHSLITGARRYNFAVGRKTNQILFTNCVASNGRHSYVSNGASSAAGIVFHESSSQGDYSASEGDRRWSQGLLFDNVVFTDPQTTTLLGLYNRGSFGTGHGWSAVHSVAWNVRMPSFRLLLLQQPPGRQNYAVGCNAIVSNQGQFIHPRGYVELTNQEPLIHSLYMAQLEKRISMGIPPDAPARLTAEFNNTTVDLNWLDIASLETGYVVEYSSDGGQNFTIIDTLPKNTTSFSHSNPQMFGSELIYRVFAIGNNCPSPFSNPVTVEITTHTRDLDIPDLRVYPNPTNYVLNISSKQPLDRIQVFHSNGQLILDQPFESQLDTVAWTPGLYLLKIIADDGSVAVRKIIK